MCDYSLHLLASRPAKVGDELVTTKFANALTRGFSSVGEPNVAVCLLPGTELGFKEEAEYDYPFAWLAPRFWSGKLGERVARFRRININQPNAHHDALEFASGEVVLVTRLCPGQHVTVLQLPTQVHAAVLSEEFQQPMLMA